MASSVRGRLGLSTPSLLARLGQGAGRLLRSASALSSAASTSSGGSSRHFSSNGGDRAWKNVTPKGSNTEVFVYSPEAEIRWPDPSLGVLASQSDPNFLLPGNIGREQGGGCAGGERGPPVSPLSGWVSTRQELQVGALYMAHDFIKYTPGAEQIVVTQEPVVDNFPELPSADKMELMVHAAPLLLRKDMKSLFPGQDLAEGPLTILTVSLRTQHDMSMWSQGMEEEREGLTEDLVTTCVEVCGRLRGEGHFSDFIDPCSGTPHFSQHSSTTLSETDERMRLVGLKIEDLGCCKVLSHPKFGRNVLVGLVITNAAAGSDVLQNITDDLQQ